MAVLALALALAYPLNLAFAEYIVFLTSCQPRPTLLVIPQTVSNATKHCETSDTSGSMAVERLATRHCVQVATRPLLCWAVL